MSEKILKALMELFAIISGPGSHGRNRRSVVQSFLYRQLNKELVKDYLRIFDAYYEKHLELHQKRKNKRIGADSVKVLRICNEINKELVYKQKVIVLIQLFEFVKSDPSPVTNQELEFISAISESFYIPSGEYELIRDFTLNSFEKIPLSQNLLVVDHHKSHANKGIRHICSEYLTGQIWVMQVDSAGMYFLRYNGESEMYLNGQIIQQDKAYAFTTGTSIRNHHVKPLYFSDIVSIFNDSRKFQRIVFEAKNVHHKFRSNKTGIHLIDFKEESGRLVGIMGSSGAGKSTLLNILNGSSVPTDGKILINGIDIYLERDKVEGLIGHVSQDDLLIEELTVYQNLFYNAKLCFDDYTVRQIDETVNQMLQNLGLFDIRDVQVGTPLNKKISGGQRKRLNIALELIREPAVLFLDEPTSGLSSRDSENIMDLLKDLTLKGKLVFVVIHQPSSDIFKMFDKLLILDTGGYLIYNGNPVDSITYFKSKVHHANWADSECHACGNVNPEQIFNIVESLVIDEYGKETRTRKISPEEWNRLYANRNRENERKIRSSGGLPSISFKIPGLLKQIAVFVTRDMLTKVANMQYLIITFLEAPMLAFILSFLIKYFNVSETNGTGYAFSDNSNLPVYLFMAVIVAIFMGLTVSAEEIIKDRKMLKREAFLNLSWSGYLVSKTSVMFSIAAIQSFTFVLVGNTVLEIRGMFLQYWIILFSAWAASNVMGLLISDSFKTVVTIYILIPFLVIPQIILSGVIVKYDKLNPNISSPGKIPLYGELMIARWGYEALSVEQFMHNQYDERFYEVNKAMSIADYKKDYWTTNLQNKIDALRDTWDDNARQELNASYLALLRNEITAELPTLESIHIDDGSGIGYAYIDSLTPASVSPAILDATQEFLSIVKRVYIKIYNNANDKKDGLIREMQRSPEGEEAFLDLKKNYHNEKLTEFVENTTDFIRIVEYKGRLYQKADPIYLDPVHPFLKAHFYAPRKMFLGYYYSTFWVNTIIIWFFTIMMYFILQFRLLKRILDFLEQLHLR